MITLNNEELNYVKGGGWALAASIIAGIIWLGGLFVGYTTRGRIRRNRKAEEIERQKK